MKVLSYPFFVIILLLTVGLPLVANSAVVPWYYEEYNAGASASIETGTPPNDSSSYSGSTPMTNSVSAFSWEPDPINPEDFPIASVYSNAFIDSSSIVTSTDFPNGFPEQLGLVWGGSASASFIGEYTAAYQYFQYSFDASFLGNTMWQSFSVNVTDLTSSTVLASYELTNMYECIVFNGSSCSTYDQGLVNSSLSRNITVPTIVGNNIKVTYTMTTERPEDMNGSSMNISSYNASVTNTVVPEPISSTLFIIGGATLGIRRFWRNRK